MDHLDNNLSPTCSRSMFWNLLFTHCAFKYAFPWSIRELVYYSRLWFMLQEHNWMYIQCQYNKCAHCIFNYAPVALIIVWSNILSRVCSREEHIWMHNTYNKFQNMLLEHVGLRLLSRWFMLLKQLVLEQLRWSWSNCFMSTISGQKLSELRVPLIEPDM